MSSINDQELRQKLLAMTPFPELKTVVETCRSHGAATRNSRALEGEIPIGKVSSYAKAQKHKQWNNSLDNQENKPKQCHRCGKLKHPYDKCPAIKSECGKCHKIGHLAKFCKTNIANKQANATSQNDNITNNMNVTEIADVTSTTQKKIPRVHLTCNAIGNSRAT